MEKTVVHEVEKGLTEKVNVLVIENEEDIRCLLTDILTSDGHKVASASNGRDGIRAIEAGRPDIALIDLMLPDMGGLELLSRIKATEPQTIVIMMTGAGTVQVAVDAMKAGAHDYLSKPLVLSELKLLIDKSLDSQKQASTLSYYHDREAHLLAFYHEEKTMPKIKIESALYDRLKRVSDIAGYSGVEEFVIHMIEKELELIEAPEDDKAVEERLRGLGYIE